MERYFIKEGEGAVRITEWGSQQAPVILCLHGLGSTGLSFIELAEKLKEEFRIIAIDMPGHGKSDPLQNAGEYSLPALASWLERITETLQLKSFFFLSHSWGSFVSLFYLAAYPEKVKGTILIDGGYQSKRLKGQSMEEEMAFYEKDFEDSLETWERFLTDAVYGEVSRRSALLDQAAEDLALKKDGRFYWHARGATAASIVKGMHEHEIIDIYPELPPGIVLLQAELPATQEAYRTMASRVFEQGTGGMVKVILGTTHMVHWDKPEAVIAEIKRNWLDFNQK